MATFTNVSDFASHVAGYGKKIEGVQSRAVKAAAEVAAIAIKQAGSRYRFKGRSGGKFSLGAKVEGPFGYAGNFIAYVKADPAGFWAMVERGTHPHIIRPRRRGRRGAGSKRALATPYGVFAVVHHPGTGSIGHPWREGVAKADVLSAKVYQREVASVLGLAA